MLAARSSQKCNTVIIALAWREDGGVALASDREWAEHSTCAWALSAFPAMADPGERSVSDVLPLRPELAARSDAQPRVLGCRGDIGERFSPSQTRTGHLYLHDRGLSFGLNSPPSGTVHRRPPTTHLSSSRTVADAGERWSALLESVLGGTRARSIPPTTAYGPRRLRAVRRPAGPGWGLRLSRDDHVPARQAGFGRHRRRIEMSWVAPDSSSRSRPRSRWARRGEVARRGRPRASARYLPSHTSSSPR